MTTFRYPLPESEPTSPTHGYSDLSDEARTSLTGIAMGPSPANQLLTPDANSAEGLTTEALSWANAELNNNFGDGALGSWQRYETVLGVTVPHTVDELSQTNPNLASTLTRLYEAKQALTANGAVTPDAFNLGETMRLVVMPWQAIRNHLGDFDQWLKTLRRQQGIVTNDDNIHRKLLWAIKSNQPFYRDPENPTQLLTPTQYLDKKIAQDGAWGVMLAQTSQGAGIERMRSQSPDQMTGNGSKHLELAGHNIDAMGIFEWIALTLQNDPKKLSLELNSSWLLANRNMIDGYDYDHVPVGYWHNDGQVESDLYRTTFQGSGVRVRPAVM